MKKLLSILIWLMITTVCSSCIPNPGTPVPDPPQNIVVNYLSPTEIGIAWDTVFKSSKYKLYRSSSLDGYYEYLGDIKDPSCKFIGLKPNTSYWLRVSVVVNGKESEKSEPVTAKTLREGREAVSKFTLPPPVPENITIESQTSSSLVLKWDDLETAISYKVFMSETEGGPFTLVGEPNENTVVINELEPETSYWFKVQSIGLTGGREESKAIKGTTLPPPNSRANPAKVGETVIVASIGSSQIAALQITLLEVKTGSEAASMVQAANRFNTKLDSSREYILAKFKVHVYQTSNDEPYTISMTAFDVVSDQGAIYPWSSQETVAGLKPTLFTTVYPGGTHTGWVAFTVNKADKALAVFDQGKVHETWFQLRR